MTRRRELNVFSLSFLDIMSCGFGAVILIFVLINQGSVAEQQTANLDLILTATDLQKRLTEEQARLDELQNITHRASRETRLANQITEQLRNEMTELQTRIDAALRSSADKSALVEKLQVELAILEQNASSQLQQLDQTRDQGSKSQVCRRRWSTTISHRLERRRQAGSDFDRLIGKHAPPEHCQRYPAQPGTEC